MSPFIFDEAEQVQFIEPKDLKKWLEQEDAPFVINVTGDKAALQEHGIKASHQISVAITEFASLVNELDPDEPVVIICQLGQKSFNAAQRLIESDYSCVFSLHGGLEAWKREAK